MIGLRIAPAIAAALLLALTTSTSTVPVLPIIRTVAIAFIVLSVLAAFIPKRSDVRTHASVVLAIVAVAVTGLTRANLAYQIGCGVFVMVALAALRMPLVAARRKSPARAWTALTAIAIVAAVVTGSLLLGLPPASAIAERQVQRLAGNTVAQDDQIGFNTKMRVGWMRHVLNSDRVVMRIKGPPVEYLRGIVLDQYDRRVWSSSESKRTVPVVTDAPEGRTTTRIEMSRAALGARTPEPRWFLPHDACDVRTASGRMAVDAHGTAHPVPDNDTREIWFGRGEGAACVNSLPARSSPSAQDLDIGAKVRGQLRTIANDWTGKAKNNREALEAIVQELSRFEYSLTDRREGDTDPVVEFLYDHHKGHCELFASALALIARSIGIPTRIVVGFRVAEFNPITGLAVVRDRDAHSWVEAWVDDHWQLYDPTPVTEVALTNRTTRWDHFAEAVSLAWDRTIGFFANIGLAGWGISAAVLAVVLIIVRRFTQRAAKRTESSVVLELSKPLPAFETLATALASAGWSRTASEPLERFARRVDAAGEPWSAAVADALDRYAELRYGGIGEEPTIAKRLDALADEVTRRGGGREGRI